MMSQLQNLIEALREELQQYGEMLALLEEQQDLVVRHTTADLLGLVARIERQAQVIQDARRKRQSCQADMAQEVGLPPEAEFARLKLSIPEDFRPLLDALVRENNDLLRRVHQRSRQNHLLLARSVELMQHLINSLLPATDGPTYDESGTVLASAAPSRSFYDALG